MITETGYADESRVLTGRAVVRRRTRVDECARLDLAQLRRAGLFDQPPWTTGVCSWSWPPSAESKVFFMVVREAGHPVGLALFHQEPSSTHWLAYPVLFDWTPCPFGGRRAWFRCPVDDDGVPCLRRCRVLYRPYGARFFGCRKCWGLTYRCRQWHRDVWFEGPSRAYQLMDEIAANPRPRSFRKLWRRAQRMERATAALRLFLKRAEAW